MDSIRKLCLQRMPHTGMENNLRIKTFQFLGKQNCIKFKFLSVLDLNVSSQCDLWGLLVFFSPLFALCVELF